MEGFGAAHGSRMTPGVALANQHTLLRLGSCACAGRIRMESFWISEKAV